MERDQLLNYCDTLLNVAAWRDYAPNGLQVEGRAQIDRLVTGVTASAALIEAALDMRADAILVHHGYFWKNEPPQITGMKYRRIKQLIQNDINLIAYHLPLDDHPLYGNNAGMADLLGLSNLSRFGHQQLAWAGELTQPCSVESLAALLNAGLQRPPVVVGSTEKWIHRVGFCSGGAQDYLSDAAALGLDAYISGEISERSTHIARECDIVYFSAGHHATERFGVQRLGRHLAEQFGLEVCYIEIENPV
ncbi:Nif3-like dinuclear metal center hexameric protein [Halothiobacillus sp. DCM-1]|uniref:Nif3-like dinuclear metal center hexameric protein n=1 Tax=Halothiobacillus sp. DCM-1 TaxID=3112558 RepID=UPI0032485061